MYLFVEVGQVEQDAESGGQHDHGTGVPGERRPENPGHCSQPTGTARPSVHLPAQHKDQGTYVDMPACLCGTLVYGRSVT